MEKSAAEQLINDLYQNALRRKPGEVEYENWVKAAINGRPETIVRTFYNSEEFKNRNAVTSIFSIGHFHSPVVDPRTVKEYVLREQKNATACPIAGIPLDAEDMRQLWLTNLDFIQTTPFSENATPENRYSYLGGSYPFGDAITLRMMIGHFRPQRIIEIGSGYSTACMLDSAEHARLPTLNLTCIEPYPERLRSLMRPCDTTHVNVIDRPVQDVPEDIVDSLQDNDILFIDSTHVMKTGSDVHYEFFHLLPRLKPGVLVHFHDCGFPFEYPDKWIFELNYSWNEVYALRAFLMFNENFRVFFWNSFFAQRFTSAIRNEYPTFLRNPGTSIWIKTVGPRATNHQTSA